MVVSTLENNSVWIKEKLNIVDICGLQQNINNVNQNTLAGIVKLSGTGLHSGGTTTVTIYPAEADTGILFSDGKEFVESIATNVSDTARGTTIGLNGSRFRTIEHLMAALRGKGIDNAIVEILGIETPALDGSALQYIEAIDAVGIIAQDSPRKHICLTEPVYVSNGNSFILAVPSDEFKVTYVMDYDHPMIGSQSFSYMLDESDFGAEIAPARTFVLYEEVAALLEQELARGGSIDNVIVVWQDKFSCQQRFSNELIRHKVLDMVGDIALVGGLLKAEILAVKSGHELNVEFAAAVLKSIELSIQTDCEAEHVA